ARAGSRAPQGAGLIPGPSTPTSPPRISPSPSTERSTTRRSSTAAPPLRKPPALSGRLSFDWHGTPRCWREGEDPIREVESKLMDPVGAGRDRSLLHRERIPGPAE